MTIRPRHLVYILVALALVGGAVFWSGIISISASSGHWAITDAVLHTAMRRSVIFHARNVPAPPDLEHPALIRRGAGHFETGCAPCHGSPARPQGAVPPEMTPHPPPLAPVVDEWEPRHLFWIVKHGVKFTGMPAWPALSRDDEVWAVTAFLLALPGMDAARYTALAYGEADPPSAGAGGLSLAAHPPLEDCVRCHGRDGTGEANGAFPRLDIQTEVYLRTALAAYHHGRRVSGIMESAAAPLTEAEIATLAEHYAREAPAAPAALDPASLPADLLARGEAVARHGIPAKDIGACLGCHESDTGRPDFPRLHGQYRGYLALQLDLFASGARRGGAEFAHLMSAATHKLEPADIEAVAAWFASRDPAARAAILHTP